MTTNSESLPDVHEPWIVEQQWNLTYRHTADEVTATFFRALRDDRKLLGIRCPECGRVLVPPREFCDRDFCRTTDWVKQVSQPPLSRVTKMIAAMRTDLVRIGQLTLVQSALALRAFHKNTLGADGLLLTGIDIFDLWFVSLKPRHSLKDKG